MMIETSSFTFSAGRVETKKKAEEEQKKQEAQAKGHEVGSNLNFKPPVWQNANAVGLLFQTENQDFSVHIGGRLQADSVWWKQPGFLKGAPPGNGGVPAQERGGGIGVCPDLFGGRERQARGDGACAIEGDAGNVGRVRDRAT